MRPNNYLLAFCATGRLQFACYSVWYPFSFYSVSFLGYTTLFCMTGKWNWKWEKKKKKVWRIKQTWLYTKKKCALHSFAYCMIKLPKICFYKSATYWSLWEANRNSGHREFAALYFSLFKSFKTTVLSLSCVVYSQLNCKVIFLLTLQACNIFCLSRPVLYLFQ